MKSKFARSGWVAAGALALALAASSAYAATTSTITTTTAWQIKTLDYDNDNCVLTGTLSTGAKRADTAVNCGSDIARVRKYTVQPGLAGYWSSWYFSSLGVVSTPSGGSGEISLGEHKATY